MNTAAIKPFIFSGGHRFFSSSQILPQDPDESSSRLTTDCDRSFPGLLHMCHTMLPCCLCSGGRFVFVPLCHSVLAFNLFQTHPYFLCSVKWCYFFVDSLFLKRIALLFSQTFSYWPCPTLPGSKLPPGSVLQKFLHPPTPGSPPKQRGTGGHN